MAPALAGAGRIDEGVRVALLGDSTAVIVHSAVPDTVTAARLQSLMTLGTQRWSDGTPVTLVVLAAGRELHHRFCREHLGTYSYAVRRLWDRRIMTGSARAPLIVHDVDAMRQRVSTIPGAIGYTDRDISEPPRS